MSKSFRKENERVWFEELDRVPLKQRWKMLMAANNLPASLPSLPVGSKGDDQSQSEDFQSSPRILQEASDRPLSNVSHRGAVLERVIPDVTTSKEVDSGSVRVVENTVLPNCRVKLEGECIESSSLVPLGNCLNGTSNGDVQQTTASSATPKVFLDDLDHIVLKERQKMLLSRKVIELEKPACEVTLSGSFPGVDTITLQNSGARKEGISSGDEGFSNGESECHERPGRTASVAGVMSTTPRCPLPSLLCKGIPSTASKNATDVLANSPCPSSSVSTVKRKNLMSDICKTVPKSDLPTFTIVKDEPLMIGGSHSKATIDNCYLSMPVNVKSEPVTVIEHDGDLIDHMVLGDRMKLMASGGVSNLKVCGDVLSPKKSAGHALDYMPLHSEKSKTPKMKRPRKRRKTATDSVEIALEEDAPGLLQVLIDKGVLLEEMKLYGDKEIDESLDDSLIEESFSELEDVISKLFCRRQSLLKLGPVRCSKGERASYCLACLISLVEQARYLQFRRWPVEWGWCRDLQSFIFVFERHNRIVLERPEYGYATYFFELVGSLPVTWQIKRLVTAMKLTNCSRITLIENKALMVGDDLTEGEARVLMEYGWVPNSGLGTMLNYCDRVVHDRYHEKDSSEWRSKIGRLLTDGITGGTIVSDDVPKKVAGYIGHSPQIKLEL